MLWQKGIKKFCLSYKQLLLHMDCRKQILELVKKIFSLCSLPKLTLTPDFLFMFLNARIENIFQTLKPQDDPIASMYSVVSTQLKSTKTCWQCLCNQLYLILNTSR
jgi:hypothetical protein